LPHHLNSTKYEGQYDSGYVLNRVDMNIEGSPTNSFALPTSAEDLGIAAEVLRKVLEEALKWQR
jgi:hypothetical protein